jgi:hypothetical protein
MPDSISKRILLAHLELNARLGRKVTQAELGAMVAERMGRGTPFTAAAVSRWETGSKLPGPAVIEAIANATSTDPGWISHGSLTMAPGPRLRTAGVPRDMDVAATGTDSFKPRRSGPHIVS